MFDKLGQNNSLKRPKRERLQSLPVKIEFCPPNSRSLEFIRRHRNSDVTINGSLPVLSLREAFSEPQTSNMASKMEVGVKSFYEWKPRRHSGPQTIAGRAAGALHEDNILGEMNLDCKFVLSPSELKDSCYKYSPFHKNPLKSELFLRVMYMLASEELDEQDPLPSIQDQFLSDEQIRENLLKELRSGVSRLNQDLCHTDCATARSGTATPVEFICNKIPGMARQSSQANLRSADLSHVSSDLSHVSSVASINGNDSDATAAPPPAQQHHRRKVAGKLSGREKNIFAPLTF